MTFNEYRSKRIVQIERVTREAATMHDEGIIEGEWERFQEHLDQRIQEFLEEVDAEYFLD